MQEKAAHLLETYAHIYIRKLEELALKGLVSAAIRALIAVALILIAFQLFLWTGSLYRVPVWVMLVICLLVLSSCLFFSIMISECQKYIKTSKKVKINKMWAENQKFSIVCHELYGTFPDVDSLFQIAASAYGYHPLKLIEHFQQRSYVALRMKIG